MIANVAGNGIAVGLTGLGVYVPERVLTNADLEAMVDTSDEWIVTRTGIRERRIAATNRRRATSPCPPPARRSSRRASPRRSSTSSSSPRPRPTCSSRRPPRSWPTRSARKNAAAYDLLAGLHRLRLRALAGVRGSRDGALEAGARDRLRDALEDHRTGRTARPASSSATARARRSSSRSATGGIVGFELGADGCRRARPLRPGRRLADPGDAGRSRGGAAVHQDERRGGLPLRDARHGQLGRGAARRPAARPWTTSTCTSRTRRTSASSTTP